jgi:hypothetical protein
MYPRSQLRSCHAWNVARRHAMGPDGITEPCVTVAEIGLAYVCHDIATRLHIQAIDVPGGECQRSGSCPTRIIELDDIIFAQRGHEQVS